MVLRYLSLKSITDLRNEKIIEEFTLVQATEETPL